MPRTPARSPATRSARRRGGACAAVLVALALGGAACTPAADAPPRRVLAEEATLRRQIEGLETLIGRVERGHVLSDGELVVAVSEKLVKDVARLALPREQVVRAYRVRLETADVRFRDGVGSVRLEGRVSAADRPPEDVFAELVLFALIDSARLMPGGRLRVEGSPIGFEVKRVGLFGDTRMGRRLLEALAAEKIDDLRALAFPLDVPVQIEQALSLKGASEGPVRVKPALVPLTMSVARVSAFDERLWIAVSVAAGAWTRDESGAQ